MTKRLGGDQKIVAPDRCAGPLGSQAKLASESGVFIIEIKRLGRWQEGFELLRVL